LGTDEELEGMVLILNLESGWDTRAPFALRADTNLRERLPGAIVRGTLPAWRARRALDYVEQNLSVGITANDMARHVHMSASHFSRAFKVTFGITVHAYVMRRRIDAAKVLIANTSDTLSDIAARCGLSDQSHMTRLFRRIVGMTPGSWRRVLNAR
jgi:AraC family transcriptional regulator